MKRLPCVVKMRFPSLLTLFTQGGAKKVRKDFIISKTRNYMSQFIQPVAMAEGKPCQKFPRHVVGAILLICSLVVMKFSRLIRDDCYDILYRVKRLLNHLVSNRGDLTQVVWTYRQQMARYIEPDTPLIIDLTDITKPRARKMKYINLVSDGEISPLSYLNPPGPGQMSRQSKVSRGCRT